jgi:uncharacterized protein (TIGR03000 family)
MYSIVLAAALASTPAVPDWHPHVGIYYSNYYYGYRPRYVVPVIQPVIQVPVIQVPANAPARLIVNLPADAKLFLQGQPTTSGSAERTFLTPALEPGYVYTYTVRAEIVRDGRMLTETKTVEVTAGNVSRVLFTETEMVRANGGQGAASVGR